MKHYKSKPPKAFSKIEVGIAIVVLAVVIVGILLGLSLIRHARLTKAMALTNSTHVSGISSLEVWVESTLSDAFKGKLDENDPVTGWFGRASAADIDSSIKSGGSDPAFCEWCVGGLPGIKFKPSAYLILPQKLGSIFSSDFILYVVERPGESRGYFINVEGSSDNTQAIGYENNTTIRFFDKTIAVQNTSGARIHMFMMADGVKYYSMNGEFPTELASNGAENAVFKFASNDVDSFANSYYRNIENKVAAQNGDYVLGRSDTAIAEVIVASAASKYGLEVYSKMIGPYLAKKYDLKSSSHEASGNNDSDGDGLPDGEDACPTVAGDIDFMGCTYDTDGDEVPDHLDACPTEPGSSSNNGCP